MESIDTERIDNYAMVTSSNAERIMKNVKNGHRLYTYTDEEGRLNYQYISNKPCGKVECFSKFGKPFSKFGYPTDTQPETLQIINSQGDSEYTKDVKPMTQEETKTQLFKDDASDEEGKMEKEEVEKGTMLAIPSGYEKEGYFEFNSWNEFNKAAEKTQKDEQSSVERWYANGSCIHCKDRTLCHIYKYGEYAINMANANRNGNNKQVREKLLISFYDTYHNAVQYMRYTKSNNDREQIKESEIEHLPHCTYRLMDNWLDGIKEKHKVFREDQKMQKESKKRQRINY